MTAELLNRQSIW